MRGKSGSSHNGAVAMNRPKRPMPNRMQKAQKVCWMIVTAKTQKISPERLENSCSASAFQIDAPITSSAAPACQESKDFIYLMKII